MEPTQSSSKYEVVVDLSNCEQEPIHTPGKIQPFGFLLAVELSNWRVLHCSDNTNEFLGVNANQLLHQPLGKILTEHSLAQIKHAVANEKLSVINPIELEFIARAQSFQGILHINSSGLLIIECEALHLAYFPSSDFYSTPSRLMRTLKDCQTVHELCDKTVKFIRHTTSYDRVMIYRFDPDWNGQVIAESRRSDLRSFFGHHFPASDIPTPSRQLYLTNRLRIIPDINHTPVSIIPTSDPITGQPLDLSNAFLRGVSPIHIEYMQNMGVVATLVIGIVIEGNLWGLIACHHYSIKHIDARMRLLLEHLGELVAYQIQTLENLNAQRYYLQVKTYENEILKNIAQKENLLEGLHASLDLLLKMNSSSGVTICWDENITSSGEVPPQELIKKIVHFLDSTGELLFHTDSLKTFLPEASKFANIASGMLAVRLSKTDKKFILWFKPETVRTIVWGGNPAEKAILVPDKEGVRLSPRKSFEKWEEIMRHRAVRWEKFEINAAYHFRLLLLEQIAIQHRLLIERNQKLQQLLDTHVAEIKKSYHEIQLLNEELVQKNEELITQSEEIGRIAKILRQKEDQLRAIFDHTKQVILFLDKQGNILFFNKQAQCNAPLLYQRQLRLGENLKTYLSSPEEVTSFEEIFNQVLKGNPFIAEQQYFSESGSRWFRVEYNPVFEENNIIGVALLLIDITHLKKYISFIERQNDVLKEIAYVQAHEVRRPVANILGLLNIFNYNNFADPFNKEVLEKMQASATELDVIIRKIIYKTYLAETFESLSDESSSTLSPT